jgi:sugar/nucleoside kinase (ribokinase family)
MSLLCVGSVAFDSVETPQARRERVLGGAAVYFSYAASYFAPVRMVGVVGDDWPEEHTALLRERGICTDGLVQQQGERTFYWRGRYEPNMNDRETLEVELNAFGQFDPKLPSHYLDSRFVFLANGAPQLQRAVLEQCTRPRLVVADTMDLWIKTAHADLLELLKRLDGLVINDSEAKLLTGDHNLVTAAQRVRDLGPKFVVVKKGEHGALYVGPDHTYVLPAFPTTRVVDPTGAGDSFAGGMMGYLASQDRVDEPTLKRALVYGTLVASFNVEDFSLDRLRQIEREQLDQRLKAYQQMLAV